MRLLALASLLAAACSAEWKYGDLDGDGYSPADGDCWDEVAGPEGSAVGGADIHPGVAIDEPYDGVDANCAGDDDFDMDRDGWVPAEYVGRPTWNAPGSGSLPGGDCWDRTDVLPDEFLAVSGFPQPAPGQVNPDAEDTWYDGIDADCAGDTDFDQDGDGWASADHPDRTGAVGDDCMDDPAGAVDDSGATVPGSAIHPDAVEICNGLDDNCNDVVDGGADGLGEEVDASTTRTFYADGDADGYGDADSAVDACAQPDGTVLNGDDCDDGDDAVSPSQDEVCNGVDDDCDGVVDTNAIDAPTWYADLDGDGYGFFDTSEVSCEQPTGYVANDDDCDDGDVTANPDGTEVCGGGDEDCDGSFDEDDASDASTWYADDDADGHGDPDSTTTSCEQPTGYTDDDTDCDDGDADVNPDASEICGGGDEDCDGETDEADAEGTVRWYLDADGDGYGTTATSTTACDAPSGYVDNDDDCDDTDASLNPDTAWYADDDGDGYGDPDSIETQCTQPSGYVADDQDCDDTDADVNPETAWYADDDDDGHGDAADTTTACEQPSGYVASADDCDDSDGSRYPGAAEVCGDGVVNDCDETASSCELSGEISLADADGILTGETGGDQFGAAVHRVADLDGDDDDELLIGAPQRDASGSAEGAGYLMTGPSSGTIAASSSTAQAMFLGKADDTWTGYAVASGDVDGDGVADIVLGAPQARSTLTQQGLVYVNFGPFTAGSVFDYYSDDHDVLVRGEDTSHDAGWSLAVLDHNGDGDDDLFIGAPQIDATSGTRPGYVYLLDGPLTAGDIELASTYDVRLSGQSNGDYLGTAMARIGDHDGDGNEDLIIGAPGQNANGGDSGAAYLILGPVSGTSPYSGSNKLGGNSSGDEAGATVGGGGDTNDDGYDDALVGSPYYGASDAGHAYLMYGSATPAAANRQLSAANSEADFTGTAGIHLGASVAMVGDVNGDSFDDVAVGALTPDPAWNCSASDDAGAVYVFYGPVTGTLAITAADVTLSGEATGDCAGVLSPLPLDANGDGVDDLLLGAPGADTVYLLYGGAR